MENKVRNSPVGNAYQVTIGDNVTGVAVGENIHVEVNQDAQQQANQQQLVALLADLDQTLTQAARLLSPYEAHMAAFHARLLRQELLKTANGAGPSADILMMAGTWLLTRTPGLSATMMRLLLAVPTTAVMAQAGDGVMQWVEARAANYEAEGFPLNLVELRQILTDTFNLSELRTLCFDMGIEFENLYGEGKADKARELVAFCVRHGRDVDLATRCRELRPFAFAGN